MADSPLYMTQIGVVRNNAGILRDFMREAQFNSPGDLPKASHYVEIRRRSDPSYFLRRFFRLNPDFTVTWIILGLTCATPISSPLPIVYPYPTSFRVLPASLKSPFRDGRREDTAFSETVHNGGESLGWSPLLGDVSVWKGTLAIVNSSGIFPFASKVSTVPSLSPPQSLFRSRKEIEIVQES